MSNARTVGSISQAIIGGVLGVIVTAVFGLLPWGELPWVAASVLSGLLLFGILRTSRALLVGYLFGALAYYALISYLSQRFQALP